MTTAYSTHHPHEPHDMALNARLNWLRAAVLGANDGVVSVAGIVMGVAGAQADQKAIAVAGIAGLVAGALSMGAGEYVSVSTQTDSEKALLAKERWELENLPDEELAELAAIYHGKGLTKETAAEVARQLTAHDAFRAHAEVELGLDPDDLSQPWHAAWASMISFTLGAILPLLTILLTPEAGRIWLTVTSVIAALALTGAVSAKLGRAPQLPAITRNVIGGAIAMAVTYGIGQLVGSAL